MRNPLYWGLKERRFKLDKCPDNEWKYCNGNRQDWLIIYLKHKIENELPKCVEISF